MGRACGEASGEGRIGQVAEPLRTLWPENRVFISSKLFAIQRGLISACAFFRAGALASGLAAGTEADMPDTSRQEWEGVLWLGMKRINHSILMS